MKDQIQQLQSKSLQELQAIDNLDALQAWHIQYLGRKQGEFTTIMKGLKDLSVEEKKEFGPLANQIKKDVLAAYEAKKDGLENAVSSGIDITLPSVKPKKGHLHLVTQTIQEVTEIFERIGFTRVRHPEVDWDYYVFEALNIPQGHPARDDQETFFIDPEDASTNKRRVLTTHTSNGQVREMEKGKLPIRMIGIGKTYRRQSDVTHTQMFHQFEGLFIDKNVTIGDLKGVMNYFARSFFGKDRKIRLRPHHFKFTEPSFEVDINCGLCLGKGCRFCKGGWVELGGSGMTHPNVLKAGGVDTSIYNGFAFGWGIERVAFMKEGLSVPDLRETYRNDLRFLSQF